MDIASPPLPTSRKALVAELVAARAAAAAAQNEAVLAQNEAALAKAEAASAKAEAANAKASVSSHEAIIEHLKLEIEKLRRGVYGPRSERSARLLEQMELQLEEAEAAASEDESLAEKAAEAAGLSQVRPFARRKPARKPFPAHIPRERVVEPAPCQCDHCGGDRLIKLGEDVLETLEVTPRQFKIIQHVREKFSCRDCEKISQPPAPYRAIPRGLAGPSFLAMMLFDKFGLHQPLNRQVDRMAQEGIPFSVSTLGDMVGHCAVALQPLFDSLQAHVLAAQRLHGDDTTVPVLAKGKTTTGRLWILARDDRPFGGEAAPAAVFYYSPDRKGEHPAGHLQNWTGILQADAYAGYNALFQTTRSPGPITWAACWAHARRKFFELADIASGARKKALGKQAATISPMALEAVRRIDAIFEIERDANGLTPDQRLDMRKHFSASLVADLETWMREQRAKLSGASPVAKAMNYMLGNWAGFVRFLTDGRICLTNNAAERGMRGIAQGRKAWLFAGSDRGGQRAACIYSLIYTARLNDIDPQAWLTDVLDRIASHPAKHVHQLLPWHWKAEKAAALKAAAQSNTVAA